MSEWYKDWLGSAPYGYELQNKKLIISDNQAKIIRDIFDMYLNKGWGTQRIAHYLTDSGIPTRFPNSKKSSGTVRTTVWNQLSVRRILRNPIYKGTIISHTKQVIDPINKI